MGLLLSAFSFSAAAGPTLPETLPAAQTAYDVVDLQTGQTLAEHRAQAAVAPASTMKLVTAFAALRLLGENHRWQTVFKTTAAVHHGRLQGDLYWVGSGDPVFDQPDLQSMLSELRQSGISGIDGAVRMDTSVWNNAGAAPGFGSDEGKTFTTPPDPHMLAYKVWWAEIGGAADGQTDRPVFTLNLPLDIRIANDARWQRGQAPCPNPQRLVAARYTDGVLRFSGSLPKSCIGKSVFVNVLDAPTFAQISFQAAWRALGGGALRFAAGNAPADARVLVRHQGKPLSEVLRDMNKFSNNTIARTVFLALGEQRGGDTVANAQTAVRRALRQSGIDDGGLILENGSGLSRRERLRAAMLAQILTAAYHAPFRETWIRSLPVGGVDGTLARRFTDTGGQWHLKTGTLDNVRALAGYWLPNQPGRHPLAVVAIVNAQNGADYETALDRWVETLPDNVDASEQTETGLPEPTRPPEQARLSEPTVASEAEP